jgi:hypothetical protein
MKRKGKQRRVGEMASRWIEKNLYLGFIKVVFSGCPVRSSVKSEKSRFMT